MRQINLTGSELAMLYILYGNEGARDALLECIKKSEGEKLSWHRKPRKKQMKLSENVAGTAYNAEVVS